jgi:hypothetical protein
VNTLKRSRPSPRSRRSGITGLYIRISSTVTSLSKPIELPRSYQTVRIDGKEQIILLPDYSQWIDNFTILGMIGRISKPLLQPVHATYGTITVLQIWIALEQETGDHPFLWVDLPKGFKVMAMCWAFQLPEQTFDTYMPIDPSKDAVF